MAWIYSLASSTLPELLTQLFFLLITVALISLIGFWVIRYAVVSGTLRAHDIIEREKSTPPTGDGGVRPPEQD